MTRVRLSVRNNGTGPFTQAVTALIALVLLGCEGGVITTVGPDYVRPQPEVSARWQSTPPKDLIAAHDGDPKRLEGWWQQFNDPDLLWLISAAQAVSASVSDARGRIEQARAEMATAISQGLPRLDTQVDMIRARTTFGTPPFDWTRYQAGVQSNWEVDLFGGLSRQREAALGRLSAEHHAWHEARVALAVEVANAYVDYRACVQLLRIAEEDARSRAATARLTRLAEQAGLRPAADLALAEASRADGHENRLQQQGSCDRLIKGLVALTGLAEIRVRRHLSSLGEGLAPWPVPPPVPLSGVPAKTLLQRPDVRKAEEEVAEASARIGVAEARRYPKLTLSGNITPQLQTVSGMSALSPYMAGAGATTTYFANTWSIGPTLNLPLFDGGKRVADVEAARMDYAAAVQRFQARCRVAAKEVEEALLRLEVSEARRPEALKARSGYERNFRATEHLYEAGFGSLLELEQARRQTLLARRTSVELEQERILARIALYRAAGGGWSSGDHPAADQPSGEDPKNPLKGLETAMKEAIR